MIRDLFYPLLGFLFFGIFGFAFTSGESPDLTMPLITGIVGAFVGFLIGHTLNQRYKAKHVPFFPAQSKNADFALMNLGTDVVGMTMLLTVFLSLIITQPTDAQITMYIADLHGPYGLVLDVVIYTLGIWLGLYILKKLGRLDSYTSSHSFGLNTALFVVLGDAASKWQGIIAAPVQSLLVIAVLCGFVYWLTRVAFPTVKESAARKSA